MRLSKFGWILLLPMGVGAALPNPTWSATFETGLDAVYAGDQEKALSIWKILAARGDARAQYRLARLYDLNSAANEKNLQRAVEWYRKAAEQGLAPAQSRLGELIAEGRGTQKDPVAASRLWRAAAEQGNAQGQYNLGLAYFQGEGTGENAELAEKWLRSAADRGFASAEFVLGQLRNEGILLAQDQGLALAWFLRASDNGHPEATAQVRALLATGVSPASLPESQSVENAKGRTVTKDHLADAEAKIAALTKDLQAARQDKNTLQKSLDEVSGKLDTNASDAAAKVALLERQLVTAQQEVKALDTETKAAVDQTALKSSELADARQEIADLEVAMKSLEKDFEIEVAADAQARKSTQEEIAVLKAQVAAGSAEAARQSESVAAAQTEIASLQKEVMAAEADVEGKTKALKKAEAVVAGLQTELSARKSDTRVNADALSAAESEIAVLKTEMTAVSVESKSRRDALAAIEQQMATLTTASNSDKVELTDRSEALTAAEEEIASLKAQVAESEMEIANRDEAIAAGELKIADLQADATVGSANLMGKDATLAEAQVKAAKLSASLQAKEAEVLEQAEALTVARGRSADIEEQLTNVEDKLIASQERSQRDLKNLNEELIETRKEVAQLVELKSGLEESLKTAEGSAKTVIDQLETETAEALEQTARVGAAAKLWEQDALGKADELTKLRGEMLEASDELAATEGLLSAKDRLLASLKAEFTEELTIARDKIQELEASRDGSVTETAVQAERAALAERRVSELTAALAIAEDALSVEDREERKVVVSAETPPAPVTATAVAAVQRIEAAKTVASVSAQAVDANLRRGDEFLALGDIASARLFYELSMDSGNKRAATSIGKTYDPVYLQSLEVVGAPGRPAKAREWYEIGAGAGDEDAVARLKALQAWEQR